eukprot:GILK01005639.1.p1 GENE.GILK01005639.1~~GILK01005639.1.p1  ORF type:complete len:969 (+),score=214.37 GILK01005639.1:81-2987(+)
MNVEVEFREAVEYVTEVFKPHLPEDKQLILYALHKQATAGPLTNSERPNAFDPFARDKWDAWKELGNMSREDAMKRYVTYLTSLKGDWKDVFKQHRQTALLENRPKPSPSPSCPTPTLQSSPSSLSVDSSHQTHQQHHTIQQHQAAQQQTMQQAARTPMNGRKSGIIMKKSDHFKKWNSRFLLLDNRRLLCYRNPQEIKPRHSYDLQDCVIHYVGKHKKDKLFSFTVYVQKDKRVKQFACLTEEEALGWVSALRDAMGLAESSPNQLTPLSNMTRSLSVSTDLSAPDAPPSPHLPEKHTSFMYTISPRMSVSGVPPVLQTQYDYLRREGHKLSATDGWTLLALQNNVRIFFKDGFYEPPKSEAGMAAVTRYKGTVVVAAPSKTIFQLIMDVSKRVHWDSNATFCQRLDTIDRHTDVIQLRTKSPAILCAPREYCLIRYWTCEADGTYYIYEKTIDHDAAKRNTDSRVKHVRGDLSGAGYIIKPSAVAGDRCLITYVIGLHPKGWIPSNLVQQCHLDFVNGLAGIREYLSQYPFSDPTFKPRGVTAEALESEEEDEERHEHDAHNTQETFSFPSESDNTDTTMTFDSVGVSAGGSAAHATVNEDDLVDENPISKDYVRHKNGGLHYINKEEIKKQKGVVMHLIKSMGANIAEGKSVLNVSLPVHIFEPRSWLQRMSDNWLFAPQYLTRAAEETDPLERFKYVITFAVAGLHRSTAMKKPFNPILGETYEGVLPDNTQIFCEQTSHHPPISHFQLFGPKQCYHFHGYYEYMAATSANSVKGGQTGPSRIDFPDGGRIEFTYPYVFIKGMIFGDRILNWQGKYQCKDLRNGYVCELVFNPDEKGMIGGMFSKSKTPADYFRGGIYRSGSGEIDSSSELVCRIEGSWLDNIDIDGVRYWSAGPLKNRVKPVAQPLPSDSRFRDDLIALSQGNLVLSQKMKEQMENIQRHDRKLRKEFEDKDKKRKKRETVSH